MPSITFIEATGQSHVIDADTGTSLMATAKKNHVPGIDADCGGGCQCGTCHVYVAPEWRTRIGVPDALEAATLGFACDVRADSRLSCQIKVTPDLDGLIIRLPQSQR